MTRARPAATRRLLLTLTPIAGGAVLALALLAATAASSAAPRGASPRGAGEVPPVRAARLAGTTAEDCAPCHAREVAQWRASAMAMASRSPLVDALESFVEEEVGRDDRCPRGAGALR